MFKKGVEKRYEVPGSRDCCGTGEGFQGLGFRGMGQSRAFRNQCVGNLAPD